MCGSNTTVWESRKINLLINIVFADGGRNNLIWCRPGKFVKALGSTFWRRRVALCDHGQLVLSLVQNIVVMCIALATQLYCTMKKFGAALHPILYPRQVSWIFHELFTNVRVQSGNAIFLELG